MTDENQLQAPESFAALYLAPGGYKSTLSREALYERFEFCDDLANMLTEHARNVLFDTGATERDVLERCRDGLLVEESGVSPAEAGWITGHLAELLNWEQLPPAEDGNAGAEPV